MRDFTLTTTYSVTGMMDDSNPKHIDVSDSSVVVGRSSIATARLFDTTVSRKHATIGRQTTCLSVVDHDSRFGTFVNGIRVPGRHACVGDRIQFGTTVVYRVDTSGLILEESNRDGMQISSAGLAISRIAGSWYKD